MMTTESQRVLLTAPKNQERIKDIRTSVDAVMPVLVRSPRIRRWMIREFNFVTGRLYLLTSTGRNTVKTKSRLESLLSDLTFAVDMLEEDTLFFKGEINETAFPGISFDLRLVSRAAVRISKDLLRADVAATKLYMSEFNGHLNRDQREQRMEPIAAALVAIKQLSIGHVPKTAAEMAAELRID